MKIWNDKKIIGLIAILLVFTIGYFIAMNKASYAFTTTTSYEELYNLTIETIKTSSESYAKKHSDQFSEDNIMVIKVQDLIDDRYLIPNEEGNVVNPMDSNKTLNSRVITIKYENDKYDITIEN